MRYSDAFNLQNIGRDYIKYQNHLVYYFLTWKIKETKDSFEFGVYGNKTILALDYSGNVYTSTNGIDYTKISKPTSQTMYATLWDGKKFLIAGERGVILSSRKSKDTEIPESEKWVDSKESYSLGYEKYTAYKIMCKLIYRELLLD